MRAVGPGGGGLELAAACWVDEIPGPTAAVPGLGSEVPGPYAAAAVPGLPAEFPVPAAGVLKSDPTASGGAGTKMESDSGDGLTDGLRRRHMATSAGIACWVEPIRAKASACSLSFLGIGRNLHPSKYPLS